MSDASGLPTDIEVGDAYALRTFAVKDGRLASIAQGGGHWEDGVCVATCPAIPRPRPRGARGGLHVRRLRLLDRRGTDPPVRDFARRIVAVIRLDGESIEGDNGVKANAAQIVAWWCAEDDRRASHGVRGQSPGTRRYFDRDVMVRIHGLTITRREELTWVTSENRGGGS